jgi:multidrug efflux pump subunit AcrB
MDKGLTYLTLKNKRFSIFLVVIVLVLGFFNYSIMPRQEVADVSPPLAQVIAVYPGGSPETIERLITSEIESEVSILYQRKAYQLLMSFLKIRLIQKNHG